MRPNRLLFWTDSKGYLRLRSFYAVYLTLKTLLTSRFYFNVIPHEEQQTVFDQITASPEVLAPNFVFLKAVFVTNINPKQQWISTLTGEVYPTKEQAYAATLEKLKEVAKV